MAADKPVRLYDANGMDQGVMLTDQDLTHPENREKGIDVRGRMYTWHQREGQWRELEGVITLADPESVADVAEDDEEDTARVATKKK